MATQTNAQLAALITNYIASNTRGGVTAAKLREVLQNMLDSGTIGTDKIAEVSASLMTYAAGGLTITGLATKTIVATAMTLSIAGYATAGDGGACDLVRSASTTPSAWNIASADGAYWQLLPKDGVVNVKSVGAKGDGLTRDDTAFTNAFSAAQALGASEVYFPRGTFLMKSRIDQSNYSGIALRGDRNATLDFSTVSEGGTYFADGLLKIHGSLDSGTEQAITKTLRRGKPYAFTSITYSAGTCTAETVDDHPFSTGDEIFIYGTFSMSAADAAFLTMKDSDEGMALSLPVTITKTGAKTFTYSPPNGGTPGASLSSPSSIFCRFNDLYVGVADTSDYARGDMVHITCDDTYAGYNGSVTLPEGENNEIEYIEGAGFWLTKPVSFAYVTTPTVTKVNPKTFVLRDIEIIGTGGSSTNTGYGQADIGLYLKWTRNCVIENVTFRDCDYAGYREAQSIGNRYEDVTVYFDKFNAGGAASGFIEIQYGGWISSGSRDAKIIRSKVFNGRHAVSEDAVSADGSGRIINLQILGADWHNQWSANFASHDMYDHILFENIRMYGGGGINVRDGNATIRNAYGEGTDYVVNAYGKVENIMVDGVVGKNIAYAGVNLAPSNKAAASPYYEGALPNVKNVKVSNVDVEGAQFAIVARCNPNTTDNPTFYWEDFTFSNISGRNLRYYVVYLSQGGSNTYGYKNGFVERIFGNNTSHLLYLGNPIDMTFSDVRGLDAKGGATCATVVGSAAANNTFLNMRGKYVGGSDMTVFSMVATSTGNKTDSIAYESKTISGGAITKNFRNVPMTVLDTEGAASTDDLTDVLGLVKGDRVTLQTTVNARDVVVKNGAGTDKTAPGYDVALSTTAQCLELVHVGYGLVQPHGQPELRGTATYNPPSLSAGSVDAIQTLAITGAAMGDIVRASFTQDRQGVDLDAWISAADTAAYQFKNKTAGTVDLPSGTVILCVEKKS